MRQRIADVLAKPRKPSKDFPLFPHATRRWAKKIKGKFHYFGPWDDPDGALQKYLDQKDDLLAGRTPRVSGDGLTVRDLCNQFLTAKRRKLDAGEIVAQTFNDYHEVCERIVKAFGLTRLVSDLAADDFGQLRASIAKNWGPVALGNEIGRCRVVFNFAHKNGLIPAPVRFGSEFNRPAKRILRQHRQAQGPRMFEAADVRKLLAAASVPMRAAIALGINCGYGNSDIGKLPIKAIDLDSGWINYPRPKTAVPRRCPLWRETVEALRAALAARPRPKDPDQAGLAFVTKYGQPWAKASNDSPLSNEVAKLIKAAGIKVPKGTGFYGLRHTFETIAGESRDQPAVDSIMGHDRGDMASVYRERISDERLQAVVDHVRKWLFPKPVKTKSK